MLDNLGNLERTHSCGDLRSADIGKPVVLMGWGAKRRDFGELTFIDLRDRAGLVQLSCNPAWTPPDVMARAAALIDGDHGYGTGYTQGQTAPLTYLGSAVTNGDLAKYVHKSDHGFITIDWDKFAKDTNYQHYRELFFAAPTSSTRTRWPPTAPPARRSSPATSCPTRSTP